VIDFSRFQGALELQQVAGEGLSGHRYRIFPLKDLLPEGPADEPDGLAHRVPGPFLGVSRPKEFTQLFSSYGATLHGQKTEKGERFPSGKLYFRTVSNSEAGGTQDLESIRHEGRCLCFLVCEAGGLRRENAMARWVWTTTPP
jgi:hypothetical protein